MTPEQPTIIDRPLDPTERCQEELYFQWQEDGTAPIWDLSRGALDQLHEVDRARQYLPDSWRKLLVVSNLTDAMRENHPDLRFTLEDFKELSLWSENLGESMPHRPRPRVDPVPVTTVAAAKSEEPPVPKPPVAWNRFAFFACLAGLVGIGAFGAGRISVPSQAPADNPALMARNATLEEQHREDGVALTESRKRAVELRLGRDNDQAAVQQANEKVGEYKVTLDKLSMENGDLRQKDQQRLKLLEEVGTLRKERDLQAKATRGPAFDLKLSAPGGGVAAPGAWETSEPSYTAVQDDRPTFHWNPIKLRPDARTVHIQLFSQSSGKLIWASDAIPAKQGTVRCLVPLHRKRKYEWLLVSDQVELGWLRIPFYLLSETQNEELQASLKKAPSSAQRAAALWRYRLYDELIPFEGVIAHDAIAAKKKLAEK